jgi:NADPH:quinone reductase-like Zn-dependent oxidoreductase
MSTITTEAWVLPSVKRQPGKAALIREEFQFPEISDSEVLAAPIYGCLEGNMLHALERDPIDLCAERGEESVVLGNSGVVRVERIGSDVNLVNEGDLCLVFGNAIWDEQGYPVRILAYDAPGTMGVLAKQMKLNQRQLIPIPQNSRYSLQQWAAFSLRYISAWANWRVAYACWQSQMAAVRPEQTIVCAWGGGVSYAQLTLARKLGCRSIMICSGTDRAEILSSAGIEPIDRRQFEGDDFEKQILAAIAERTSGKGVSIFIDNIGTPVHRITLKGLARQGVMATCGWKAGMRSSIARGIECLQRHIHVHTHYASYAEGLDAVQFAQEHDWMPPPEDYVWGWNEIPDLFDQYARGRVHSYFPIFAINA